MPSKNELQHILLGKSEVGHGTLIQAIISHLEKSKGASAMAETEKHHEEEETESLIKFVDQNNLWITDFNFDLFISEGAEQRVYIKDGKHVYKLNDAIYYTKWLDYFHSLLLNNYFFPDTSYQLIGFYREKERIYAVVEQKFVEANELTDLSKVKLFLEANGFINTRNNDYYNPDLGIILEDLHDENVLTQNGILYFIDTVFYIKPEIFW